MERLADADTPDHDHVDFSAPGPARIYVLDESGRFVSACRHSDRHGPRHATRSWRAGGRATRRGDADADPRAAGTDDVIRVPAQARQLAADVSGRLRHLFRRTGSPRRCCGRPCCMPDRGAMLSHQTAAELWGLAADTSSLIHVTVPSDRRVRKQAGIGCTSVRAAAAVHPSRNPPRTRLEETVIDLWETARDLDNAVGWVTTAPRAAADHAGQAARRPWTRRDRVRRRKQLAELLSPDAAGIHSVLEYRYVRDVERPHGLPGAYRQARARRERPDRIPRQAVRGVRTAIELDGRVAHPGDTRWKDIHRDNAAAHLGTHHAAVRLARCHDHACPVAAEIAEVLADRGYTGAAAVLSRLVPSAAQCRRTVPGGHRRTQAVSQLARRCAPLAAEPARTRPAQTRAAGTRPPPSSRIRTCADGACRPGRGCRSGQPSRDQLRGGRRR